MKTKSGADDNRYIYDDSIQDHFIDVQSEPSGNYSGDSTGLVTMVSDDRAQFYDETLWYATRAAELVRVLEAIR